MPYNLHIIHAGDFIRLNGKGGLDLEATESVLSGLAKACVDRGVTCALIDVRHMKSHLSLADLYRLARAFNEMGFRKEHHLALLQPYMGGAQAEFFAMCSADRGWNVRAFEEYEEAIEWFSSTRPADDAPPAGDAGGAVPSFPNT